MVLSDFSPCPYRFLLKVLLPATFSFSALPLVGRLPPTVSSGARVVPGTELACRHSVSPANCWRSCVNPIGSATDLYLEFVISVCQPFFPRCCQQLTLIKLYCMVCQDYKGSQSMEFILSNKCKILSTFPDSLHKAN